jgi:hypothetical protein
MIKLACRALMPDWRMRKWLLALVALGAGVVQAHAATAILLPLPAALALLALLIVVAAILWGIIGITDLVRWLSAKRRAAAQKAALLEQVKSVLRRSEQEYKAKLPLKISELKTLTDVVADGLLLTYSYTIDTNKFELMPDFFELQKRHLVEVHKSEATKIKAAGQTSVESFGAIHRYSYFDPQAKPLGTFDVTSADFE